MLKGLNKNVSLYSVLPNFVNFFGLNKIPPNMENWRQNEHRFVNSFQHSKCDVNAHELFWDVEARRAFVFGGQFFWHNKSVPYMARTVRYIHCCGSRAVATPSPLV